MRGGENSHGASSPAGITSISGRFVGADAFAIFAHYGNAIPAFARQYGTSCATCHIDFPNLKDFGKAFKDAGFKVPKDEAAMLKIPPVMLGAPANQQLWPKAIWPGTIPGISPIGLRYNNYLQFTSAKFSRTRFNPLTAGDNPDLPSMADFETGLFSIFTAGNFGRDIASWVDDDFSVSGANANSGLGEAYLRFVNIGRLMKLPPNSLNFRVGQMSSTSHSPSPSQFGSVRMTSTPRPQWVFSQPGSQSAVCEQFLHPGRFCAGHRI